MAFRNNDARLLLMMMRDGQLGPQTYEAFLVLAGERQSLAEVSADTLRILERLGIGRPDYDVIGQRDVFLLTTKGKRLRDQLRSELKP